MAFVSRRGVNLGLFVGVVMVVGMIGASPQIQVEFQTVRVVVGLRDVGCGGPLRELYAATSLPCCIVMWCAAGAMW